MADASKAKGAKAGEKAASTPKDAKPKANRFKIGFGGKKGSAADEGGRGGKEGAAGGDTGASDGSDADEPEVTKKKEKKGATATAPSSKKQQRQEDEERAEKRSGKTKKGGRKPASEGDSDGEEDGHSEDEAKEGERGCGAADDTMTVQPPSGAMRKTVGATMRPRSRPHAENCNEVHVVGQVVGGTGFPRGVACKWFMDHGKNWAPLGDTLLGGQSQVDYAADGGMAVWCHPIDVHFAQGSVQGWPRLLFQVLQLDAFGRNEVIAYGFVNVPASVGCYELECTTWRPIGSLQEEISAFFIGGQPQLTTDNVIFNTCVEASDSCASLRLCL